MSHERIIVKTRPGRVIREQAKRIVASAEQGPPGAQGPAGPAGPQGPPGAGGGTEAFVFEQTTPAFVWTIDHDIEDHLPSVSVIVAGAEVIADVLHISSSQLTVTFHNATAGTAVLI